MKLNLNAQEYKPKTYGAPSQGQTVNNPQQGGYDMYNPYGGMYNMMGNQGYYGQPNMMGGQQYYDPNMMMNQGMNPGMQGMNPNMGGYIPQQVEQPKQ